VARPNASVEASDSDRAMTKAANAEIRAAWNISTTVLVVVPLNLQAGMGHTSFHLKQKLQVPKLLNS